MFCGEPALKNIHQGTPNRHMHHRAGIEVRHRNRASALTPGIESPIVTWPRARSQ